MEKVYYIVNEEGERIARCVILEEEPTISWETFTAKLKPNKKLKKAAKKYKSWKELQ